MDWIQVEVTSHCNATCSYCPRTVYRGAWRDRILSPKTFERLSVAFPKTKLVYLQGWGEPFLNPELMTMARIAKAAGCAVGTTTNGMLLNAEMIRQLVACGIDVLAFSLAGVDDGNDTLRRGTRLDTVVDAIRILHETKKKLGKQLPAVHIAYILLRSRLGDIERLPLFLKELAVDHVVLSTLDFVPCKALEDETIIPSTVDEYEALRARLEAVRQKTEQWGVGFHYRLHQPGGCHQSCTENVQRSLFVSADGEVSSCVFTNLPLPDEFNGYPNQERPYRRLSFGNLSEASIGDIWRASAYRDFRKAFSENRLPSICEDCSKLFVG